MINFEIDHENLRIVKFQFGNDHVIEMFFV